MDIGNRIKELRLESKITQEELAKFLQISTQAVSKWECGGAPDLELIPKIASYFNITIDYLFDISVQNYKDMEQRICNYISSLPTEEDRFYKMHEIVYLMSIAAFSHFNIKEYVYKKILESEKNYYSLCNVESGFAFTSLNKENPFYLLFPKPLNNKYDGVISSKDKQLEFLKELANEDFYDVLVYINSRVNKSFTAQLIKRELGIDDDRANEIINALSRYDILGVAELELNEEIIKTYKLNDSPMIVAMFAVLDVVVNRPNCFYHYVNNKNGEYFENRKEGKND
jgi:transcriptional regulator with XRE-family HTH domain